VNDASHAIFFPRSRVDDDILPTFTRPLHFHRRTHDDGALGNWETARLTQYGGGWARRGVRVIQSIHGGNGGDASGVEESQVRYDVASPRDKSGRGTLGISTNGGTENYLVMNNNGTEMH